MVAVLRPVDADGADGAGALAFGGDGGIGIGEFTGGCGSGIPEFGAGTGSGDGDGDGGGDGDVEGDGGCGIGKPGPWTIGMGNAGADITGPGGAGDAFAAPTSTILAHPAAPLPRVQVRYACPGAPESTSVGAGEPGFTSDCTPPVYETLTPPLTSWT